MLFDEFHRHEPTGGTTRLRTIFSSVCSEVELGLPAFPANGSHEIWIPQNANQTIKTGIMELMIPGCLTQASVAETAARSKCTSIIMLRQQDNLIFGIQPIWQRTCLIDVVF